MLVYVLLACRLLPRLKKNNIKYKKRAMVRKNLDLSFISNILSFDR